MEIVLTKTADGALLPVDPQGLAYIAKLKLGAAITATTKHHNNPAFHRKMMALFNLGFEAWEPGELEYKGEKVGKTFDQFRKDITVMAGYYEASVNFRGEVRLTAKSLNFSTMEQDEREALYSDVINVLLRHVLTRYTRDDLDNVVNQLMGFT